MSHASLIRTASLALVVGILAQMPALAADGPDSDHEPVGNAYTMNNDISRNQVLTFSRNREGALTFMGRTSTGGQGAATQATFDPLGSQDSVVVSEDRRMLYVVNAGSNQISALRLSDSGAPELVQVVASGGIYPASLALDRDVLYVLNKGSTGSIQGFRVSHVGLLTRLPGSSHGLNVTPSNPFQHVPAPEQIKFDRLYSHLIVSYGGARKFFVFPVDSQGVAGPAVTSAAYEALPFGIAITRHGQILVADPVTSALGSYSLDAFNQLESISQPLANGQRLTCWVVFDGGEYAYTANTAAGTVSAYHVARNGELALVNLDGVGVSLGADARPTEIAITHDGRALYVLDGGTGRIVGLKANPATGVLRPVGDFGKGVIPVLAGVQGLAIR